MHWIFPVGTGSRRKAWNPLRKPIFQSPSRKTANPIGWDSIFAWTPGQAGRRFGFGLQASALILATAFSRILDRQIRGVWKAVWSLKGTDSIASGESRREDRERHTDAEGVEQKSDNLSLTGTGDFPARAVGFHPTLLNSSLSATDPDFRTFSKYDPLCRTSSSLWHCDFNPYVL
jgi:hypothetical protein